MEDRYEIRGKIGQGGIGSVHRAYDHKMRRQVAIKRILTSCEDPTLEEEATKQLLTEVRALASLQHPHIVTVYDVGADEEGPYVVMELIEGKTLDEIVENAPLTWHDFRIVAMQSLEALIAAQELDMIHSDLKPPNIMLTWMPSGAFQVKIVDFGLATLIHNQSQEEIENMEAIWGSIFFVPPEQYERKTLDTRSDLYSLGCCFYQALAGSYPFDGTTGMEVMQAHLNHTVRPIQEIRSDIPLWACNWVMWLINRFPDDRPSSAREALASFEKSDKDTNPVMGQGGAASSKQPRLIIPSSAPFAPSSPTSLVLASGATSIVQTAAVPTATHSLGTVAAMATADTQVVPDTHEKPKPPKNLLKFAIPAAAVLLIVITASLVMKRNERIRKENVYASIVNMAVKKEVEQVPIDGTQLKIIFDFILNSKPGANLTPEYAALAKATATDGTNIDAAIADFATTAKVPDGLRPKLFEQVIGIRENAATVPGLIKFSASAKDPDEASAAFSAVRRMIREEHAEGLLGIIATTSHSNVRQAAESEMTYIITRSQKRNDLAGLISSASKKAEKPASREALDRLMALCKPQPQFQPKAQTQTQPAPKPQTQASSARVVVPTSFNWGCDTFIGSTLIVDQNTGRTPVLQCTLPSPVEKNPQLIYLKFHLAGVELTAAGGYKQAELQMYNADTKATGIHTVKIYGLNNADNLDQWADHTLDITNAPAISDRAKLTLDTTKLTELGTLKVDFDQLSDNAPLPIFSSPALMNFLKTDTDQRVSLLIATESISAGGSSHFGIRSRDFSGGRFAPALIFTPQPTSDKSADTQKPILPRAGSDNAALTAFSGSATSGNKPVKVYILAGQSNMVGMGQVSSEGVRWGDEFQNPVVSVYEGAYDPNADYDALKPTQTQELTGFGSVSPPAFPKGGVRIVRGFIQPKINGLFEFRPGWGDSENNIMVVNGVEVHRKEPSGKAAKKPLKLTAGERVPFKITYLTEGAGGHGWVSRLDVPGSLSSLIRVEGKYPYLIDKDGNWVSRDDVWYKGVVTATANKWLSIGCGASKGNIGPELGFGFQLGDFHDEPVLLLKASDGNRSLAWDFLPPGSERYEIGDMVYAGYKDPQPSWKKGEEPTAGTWYAGKQYDVCFLAAKDVLKNFDASFPHWKGRGYEIAGFVWFQGHKDTASDVYASRYEQNLVQLIKALRKEFDVPNAPFVVITGCGNQGREGTGLQIAEAQLAVDGDKGKYPEFKGNVKSVDIRDFWPDAKKSPVNQGSQYHQNAGAYMQIGEAMGKGMVELLK